MVLQKQIYILLFSLSIFFKNKYTVRVQLNKTLFKLKYFLIRMSIEEYIRIIYNYLLIRIIFNYAYDKYMNIYNLVEYF